MKELLPGLADRMRAVASSLDQWHAACRAVGCVVCRRFAPLAGRVELHHVAEGSGLRSDWAVVPLCELHHRGSHGLHGISPEAFCKVYRVPGEIEWGLLVWTIEDVVRLGVLKRGA